VVFQNTERNEIPATTDAQAAPFCPLDVAVTEAVRHGNQIILAGLLSLLVKRSECEQFHSNHC